MSTILLVIIYISFISLGLPDSILGSAWPMMHLELNVPVSYAGIATMIVAGGTIISSLFSERLIKRFGTGKVTAISVLMTALGLIGTYMVPGFWGICLLGIPLGLGAGAVDSALNNFVALHYEAKHMNWLHCFWGVGATAGPFIMSFWLLRESGWRMGYATIGLIQGILVICLFVTLPLWKKMEKQEKNKESEKSNTRISELLEMRGAKPALIAFFCYCGVELTTGLWGSTFLVDTLGLSAEKAAKWVSIYYLGITVGRLLAGFLAIKLNNIKMMRLGQIICLLGVILLGMPFTSYCQLIGLMLIGLGCAPIYPAMLHETPQRFGKEQSQGIMGIQMACAYVGSTFIPPVFGFLAKGMSFKIMPVFLMIFVVLMFICSEMVNRGTKKPNNI